MYGDVAIDDPAIEALIGCQTFRRLKGVRQAGPSGLAFPFKNVTRYEHSLGVFELLARLGATRKERVAGLLHDISHTAFSHAVDFLYTSEEQAHHEELKPLFLRRADVRAALRTLGYQPEAFFDDSVYPLLERPIPWLCADRLDYFFRDGLACGVCEPEDVTAMLEDLIVIDRTIGFQTEDTARRARELFAEMNRDWWASATEAFIYNEFGQVLKLGLDRGILRAEDLLEQDDAVLAKLRRANDPEVDQRLRSIVEFQPAMLEGYEAKITPKERWLDPPVEVSGKLVRLSELEAASARG